MSAKEAQIISLIIIYNILGPYKVIGIINRLVARGPIHAFKYETWVHNAN